MSIESNEIDDIFYKMLEDSMLRYKINQRGLADKLNKNPSMISRWLKREAKPHIGTINEISTKLNYKLTEVDNKWILTRSNESELDTNSIESNKNCGEILLNVLREIMNEASEADRAVLGPHFLEISHRLNQRLKNAQE